MSDRDGEFDAWLHDADDDIMDGLDAVVDTEANLLQLKQNAATRAVFIAHNAGSDAPDRVIRSVLATETRNDSDVRGDGGERKGAEGSGPRTVLTLATGSGKTASVGETAIAAREYALALALADLAEDLVALYRQIGKGLPRIVRRRIASAAVDDRATTPRRLGAPRSRSRLRLILGGCLALVSGALGALVWAIANLAAAVTHEIQSGGLSRSGLFLGVLMVTSLTTVTLWAVVFVRIQRRVMVARGRVLNAAQSKARTAQMGGVAEIATEPDAPRGADDSPPRDHDGPVAPAEDETGPNEEDLVCVGGRSTGALRVQGTTRRRRPSSATNRSSRRPPR